MNCRQPDHDNSKLVCGYSLPCPWHTATLHCDKEPATVEVPTTATNAQQAHPLLTDIAALSTSRSGAEDDR